MTHRTFGPVLCALALVLLVACAPDGASGSTSERGPDLDADAGIQHDPFRHHTAPLSDIEGHAARYEIERLQWQRVISGFEDGTFRPDAPVTRAQFAAMLVAAFPGHMRAVRTPNSFHDVPATHWAHDAIQTASPAGYLSGYGSGRFEPERGILRAEAVAALVNGLRLRMQRNHSYPTPNASSPEWAKDAINIAASNGIFVNIHLNQWNVVSVAASRAHVASYVFYAMHAVGTTVSRDTRSRR